MGWTGTAEELRAYNRAYYERNREARTKYAREYTRLNQERISAQRKARYKEDPRHFLLQGIKSRAKRKGLEFNLSIEDLEIPTRCPVFGVELVSNIGSRSPAWNSPSLDRIDSSKGYVKGNVQWLSFLANVMKRDATIDQLISFANWIQRTYGQDTPSNS